MLQTLERLRSARLLRQRSASDLDALVRGTIGLHSTDYATPYLSARARIAGFTAQPLFARLNAGDGLVRVNAMRNTVHVVHTDDLATILAATGPAVGAVGRRSLKDRSDAQIAAGVEALCRALDGGPLDNAALKAACPEQATDLRSWLYVAMGAGEVIRADAPRARSNRTRYARTPMWIPGFVPGTVPADEARRALILRGVRAFGPLTVEDLAWWLPAPKAEVRRALASAAPGDLASIEVEGQTFWYAADLEGTEAPPRESHGAWALPYEDAFLKGSLDRGGWLAPGLRDVLFPLRLGHWFPPDGAAPGPGPLSGPNVSGEARPSIWWGGRAVGRWEERDGGVVWQLHADIGAEGREAVSDEMGRVGRFLQASGL